MLDIDAYIIANKFEGNILVLDNGSGWFRSVWLEFREGIMMREFIHTNPEPTIKAAKKAAQSIRENHQASPQVGLPDLVICCAPSRKRSKGFSLIELLVVLAILAIIAAGIVSVTCNNFRHVGEGQYEIIE